MRLISFDTETYLITDTDSAPKPVCCTWYEGTTASISHPGDMTTAVTFADPRNIYVGQNIAYDLVLMMRWHPRLIPDIIRALDEGRVYDIAMRERLIHLATVGSTKYEMFPSLLDLAAKYLKLDLSKDKQGDDIWRLKYGTLDGVPFNEWPREALAYAMDDAVHTYNVFMAQGGLQGVQPTECAQVQAAVVLQAIGVYGFAVNQSIKEKIGASLEAKAKALHEKIDKYQWTGKGSQARMQDLIQKAWQYKQFLAVRMFIAGIHMVYDENAVKQYIGDKNLRVALKEAIDTNTPIPGLTFPTNIDWRDPYASMIKGLPDPPMTKEGYSASEETLEKLMDVVPAFAEYVEMRHLEKMLKNYIEPYKYATAHPRFVPLVSTGRTGCRGGGSSANMQNIPRKDKKRPDEAFRTMFMARPGRVLGTTDYSQLELCTLAATIRSRYGMESSKLGDAIDKGIDVHCFTGGIMSGRSYEQMIEGKTAKDQSVLMYRQGAKACFSADTELLTEVGWARIDALFNTDTKIAQYNPHTKAIEFVCPMAWVHKQDEVINIETTHMSQSVTNDHRLLFVSRAGVVREVLAGDMHSLDIGGNNWSSVHGGHLHNTVRLSDLTTRLSVMVQADGNFNKGQVRLGFTKTRKINRCRDLLTQAGVPFEEAITSQGVTTFTAQRGAWYTLDDDKTFVSIWRLYDQDAFCDELFRWDGSVAKKHHASYGSAIKKNVDVAQAILTTNGYKTAYHVDAAHDNKQEYHKIEWYIGDRKKNTSYHRFGEIKVTKLPKQEVYCPSVPSSWVLIRHNGKVTVSGNCNFGLPGGLSAPALVRYAETQYGVKFSIQEGFKWVNAWKKAWPEIPNQYLSDHGKWCNESDSDSFTAWTLTGRPKAYCSYTEGSNYPFQGLAADGAKAALYGIWREEVLGWHWSRTPGMGYGCEYRDSPLRDSHIVNFIHDEIVNEHPAGDLGKAALKRQDEIMISEMTRICQNLIRISVESNLSDAWEH